MVKMWWKINKKKMKSTPSSTNTNHLHLIGRKAPPSQYTFKIKSFSWLLLTSQEISSEEFEAGGYKWSLSIGGGQGHHVSIYLVLMEPNLLPLDWEVHAIVNFFAYNFINDEYATTQDVNVRRFHVLKTEWGMPDFIDIGTFRNPSNGYLVDDTCVFGCEIFFVKNNNKGHCISLSPEFIPVSYTWKFNKFFQAKLDKYDSESFVGGNYKWKLRLFPNGNAEEKANSISLFLVLEGSTLPPDATLVVSYAVRAKNQSGGRHAELKSCARFSHSSLAWGCRELLSLAKLEDSGSGFLVDDTCILEANFTILKLITPGIN